MLTLSELDGIVQVWEYVLNSGWARVLVVVFVVVEAQLATCIVIFSPGVPLTDTIIPLP